MLNSPCLSFYFLSRNLPPPPWTKGIKTLHGFLFLSIRKNKETNKNALTYSGPTFTPLSYIMMMRVGWICFTDPVLVWAFQFQGLGRVLAEPWNGWCFLPGWMPFLVPTVIGVRVPNSSVGVNPTAEPRQRRNSFHSRVPNQPALNIYYLEAF